MNPVKRYLVLPTDEDLEYCIASFRSGEVVALPFASSPFLLSDSSLGVLTHPQPRLVFDVLNLPLTKELSLFGII